MSILVGETCISSNPCLGGAPLPTDFVPEEYGFAFIKSGFEHVRPDLTADFYDYGIDVIGVAPVVLKPNVVDYVYRDSRQEPFYAAMFKHLITQPVVAMALHSDTQNTQATVNDLKSGKNGLPCLRQKYMPTYEPLPESEIDAWYQGTHPNQDKVTVQLTQKNVFHAADTSDEAVESLRLLSTHNAEFWFSSRPTDRRVSKLAKYLTFSQAQLILS